MLTDCVGVLQEGKPKIYISHGTNDEVLSIDYCSRRLVPRLQKQGYDVRYHEFGGPHTVPRSICQEGIHWFVGQPVEAWMCMQSPSLCHIETASGPRRFVFTTVSNKV